MIETLITCDSVTIREACRTLGVSESGFYAHRHKHSRLRRQQDEVLACHIQEVFESTYQCYGSPRLVKALHNRELKCGKTRIRRLMVQEGLCPRQKRRFRPQTTKSHPYLPCASNLVGELPSASAPAQRFHSDITYILTKEGVVYLAATIDAFTRRCAGWCIRDNMESQLVKEAARMAFAEENVTGSFHHSDRGSQYASEGFRLLLEKKNIVQSMSRKGNCYDNALSESFGATVKTECFDNFREGIPSIKAQVVRFLFHYIELFYNRERLHSALGYKSPVQFENDWTHDHCTNNVST